MSNVNIFLTITMTNGLMGQLLFSPSLSPPDTTIGSIIVFIAFSEIKILETLNGCEVIYEIFHMLDCGFEIKYV